ncbi:MAG: cysteine desulfurase family protein [Bacilli bacterium]
MNKVYLDNSGSTVVLDEVLETYITVSKKYYANSSAVHNLANEGRLLFNESKKQIASLCNVLEEEIFFTSGASESINTAIKGYVLRNLKRKNHIIVTTIDHSSTLNTVKYLKDKFNIIVDYVSPENGEITSEMIMEYVNEDTLMVSLPHVQSETGYILPIEEIAKVLKNNKIVFHVDASQSIGKIPIEFSNYDMISASFHKIHGVKGIGLLYKKKNVLIDELIHGGNQQTVRSGTINLPACVSSSRCLRLIFEDLKQSYLKVCKLNEMLRKYFNTRDDVVINSSNNCSPYILNISLKDINSAALSRRMWNLGYFFSNNTSCNSNKDYSNAILEFTNDLKLAANSIRISISKFTTELEIKSFIAIFEESIDKVRGNDCG